MAFTVDVITCSTATRRITGTTTGMVAGIGGGLLARTFLWCAVRHGDSPPW
jgi:hypothetical protein